MFQKILDTGIMFYVLLILISHRDKLLIWIVILSIDL